MNTLEKKLLIKKASSHLVINSPKQYNQVLNSLVGDFELKTGQTLDWVLIFVNNQEELKDYYTQFKLFIDSNTIFWVAYPKKSSKIKSDISRDEGWDIIYSNGFRTISLISLDETWSVMRFGEGEMPDLTKKTKSERTKLIIPPELKVAFKQDNSMAIFFNSLAYTYRKEYINWINEAKKEETRKNRISKTLELLKNKQKTK